MNWSQRFYRHANRDYLQWAAEFGLVDRAEQIVLQIYSEPLQRFRLAADGHGHVHPPEQYRERLRKHFDPLPIWYPPFEEAAIETRDFPLHALTQRPMAMYHSWGSQNAWLRQIHGRNHLYINRQTAKRLDLADENGSGCRHHGRIRCRSSDGRRRRALDLECHQQAARRLERPPRGGGASSAIT
jgi:anaerobic selenocysteine-containing dehydrogenase